MTPSARLSEDQLSAWGRAVGERVRPPLFLALDGPLGAGKSVLARGVARGMGVQGAVPSPTYPLVRVYEPRPGVRLVHADLYRIDDPDAVPSLGWDDWVHDPEAVVVVEWAVRAGPWLPPDRWEVRLAPVAGRPEFRCVAWEAVGDPAPLPDPRVGGSAAP